VKLFLFVCVCHVDVNVVCLYNVETLERKECWCVGDKAWPHPSKFHCYAESPGGMT